MTGGTGPAVDVGFIGLGNVGSKLAGNLVTNGVRTTVHDIDADAVARLVEVGAEWQHPQQRTPRRAMW